MVPATGSDSNRFDAKLEGSRVTEDDGFEEFDGISNLEDLDTLFDVLDDWETILEHLPSDISEPQP